MLNVDERWQVVDEGEWAPAFRSLRLDAALAAEIERWGVGSFSDLAVLGVAVLEGCDYRSSEHGGWPAALLLQRLPGAFYDNFLFDVEPEVSLSVDCDGTARRYAVKIYAQEASIEAVTRVTDRASAGADAPDITDSELLDQARHSSLYIEGVPSPQQIDPLDDLRTVFDSLDDRHKSVVAGRFGLSGSRQLTLEEMGRRMAVTRERVRQIEEKAHKLLRAPARIQRLDRLACLLQGMEQELECHVCDSVFTGVFERRFPLSPPAAPWLRLVCWIKGWHEPAERTARSRDQRSRVVKTAVVEALARRGPLKFEDLLDFVGASCQTGAGGREALVARVRACGACRVGSDGLCHLEDRPIEGIPDQRLRRLNTIIGVLENDGPTHFAELAPKVNERILPAYRMTKREVHAWLSRRTDYFVWAGPGTFALADSQVGHSLPRQDLEVLGLGPTRRAGIGDEIAALLHREGRALSLSQIENHVLSRFRVNATSVLASLIQDRAKRFSRNPDDTWSLRSWAHAPGDESAEPDNRNAAGTQHFRGGILPREDERRIAQIALDLYGQIREKLSGNLREVSPSQCFQWAVLTAAVGDTRAAHRLLEIPSAGAGFPVGARTAVLALGLGDDRF